MGFWASTAMTVFLICFFGAIFGVTWAVKNYVQAWLNKKWPLR